MARHREVTVGQFRACLLGLRPCARIDRRLAAVATAGAPATTRPARRRGDAFGRPRDPRANPVRNLGYRAGRRARGRVSVTWNDAQAHGAAGWSQRGRLRHHRLPTECRTGVRLAAPRRLARPVPRRRRPALAGGRAGRRLRRQTRARAVPVQAAFCADPRTTALPSPRRWAASPGPSAWPRHARQTSGSGRPTRHDEHHYARSPARRSAQLRPRAR